MKLKFLILFIFNYLTLSSDAFVIFKKNFCKAFDSERFNRTLDYTAVVRDTKQPTAQRIPIDIQCHLHDEKSICMAYIKYDIIKSKGLYIHGDIDRPISFPDRLYYQMKRTLPGHFIGHVNFKRSFSHSRGDDWFIYVDFIITNYVGQQKLSGIGTALMAVMFDIADRCNYPSVELFALSSAKPFYQKLGMTLVRGNHEFSGNMTLARHLKQRSKLKLIKVT